MSILPSSVAFEVREIIYDPPRAHQYDTLKQEVVKRFSKSDQQKIDQLLTLEYLGDRKPSQLLRSMRSLVGGNQYDCLLRKLFIQRLPTWIQPFLCFKEANTSLDELAETADRIFENSPNTPNVSAVGNSRFSHENNGDKAAIDALLKKNESLEKQIETLTRKFDEFSNSNRPTGRARPRFNQRNNNRASSPRPMCWYHRTWGVKARACTQPCSFNSGN